MSLSYIVLECDIFVDTHVYVYVYIYIYIFICVYIYILYILPGFIYDYIWYIDI